MAWETKLQIELKDEEFENELLIHRPELYAEINQDPRENLEIEEFVPETAEDVQSMLAEIQREGFLE